MKDRRSAIGMFIPVAGITAMAMTGCQQQRPVKKVDPAPAKADQHAAAATDTDARAHTGTGADHGKQASHAGHAAHWGYTGAEGPANWGNLSPDYEVCKDGRNQSPVDILNPVKAGGLDPLEFGYSASPLQILNNGHTIQVNYAAGSYVKAAGVRYDLVQFHFHSPSENQVASQPFPLEMHLVHKSEAGKLAVVGVLFEKGDDDPTLAAIWEHMPPEKTEAPVLPGGTVDANLLLPPATNRNYYHFSGSLTTPPCTEGVHWFVMNTPRKISQEQVDAFLQVINANARPVQPLNGRTVMASG